MSALNWLHLTDLHVGMNEQQHLWPNIRSAFFEDLKRQYDKSGPWDVVFFTGDLVQQGSAEEFRKLEGILQELWACFAELGCNPSLLAVPGNHDLARPRSDTPEALLLSKWAQNPEIHEAFWTDPKSPYRQLVNSAFENYTRWWSECPFRSNLAVMPGLLPGDFATTIERGGSKFGIVGLNTAFLQLSKGDFTRRLIVDQRQFHTACGGDGPRWSSEHNTCILLTHHPRDWLIEDIQQTQIAEIAPSGRFAAHFFGHMHEDSMLEQSSRGGLPHRLLQGRSLFGLEHYGEVKNARRSHGYMAGRIILESTVGHIQYWPRSAKFDPSNGWSIIPNHNGFSLDEDGSAKSSHFETVRSITDRQPPTVTDAERTDPAHQLPPSSLVRQNSFRRWPWPRDEPDLREYCEAIALAHGYIRFVEIPFLRDTSDVEIDNLYVSPRLSEKEIHADTPPDQWPRSFELIDILRTHERLILLGDPGSGKSTLTSCLSWQLCQPKPKSENYWTKNFGGLVPLPIVLRELNLKADLSWEGLLDAFLEHRIGKLLRNRDHIESLLRAGRAVVLLDGLDEIGNLTVRRKLRHAIGAGVSAFPQSRWILTSRVVGYEQVPFHINVYSEKMPSKARARKVSRQAKQLVAMSELEHNFDLYYLAPFTDKQIQNFASNWYAQHERDDVGITEKANEFVQAIRANDGTQRLARIPYLLTLMALIHHKNARLPHGRTELYDRIAAAYLESIDLRRKLNELPYSLTQKKRWLADIAYRMQLRRSTARDTPAQGAILATKKDVHHWLTRSMTESGADDAKQEAQALLDYFARRSGLLLPRGESRFAFMHLSLQEYFAASFLEPRLTASRFSPASKKRPEPSDEQLWAWANEMAWRETFVLLFELLANKLAMESEGLLRHLFDGRLESDTSHKQHVAATLLAELITDPFVTLSAETRRQMRQRCWHWEFSRPREKRRGIFGARVARGVVHSLLSESGGDLAKAWQAAGISSQDLAKVKHLDLSDCVGLVDLSPLTALRNLKALNLSGCVGLRSVNPLADLQDLTFLDLSGCKGLTDFQLLVELSGLRELSIKGCGRIVDYDFLSRLGHLESIALSVHDKSALDFLSKCIGLTNLTVQLNGIEQIDLSPLFDLPKLGELVVDGKGTSINFSKIPQTTAIKSLHLHEMRSGDLAPLVGLSQLRRLCLVGSLRLMVPDALSDRLLSPQRRIGSTLLAQRKEGVKGRQ